ncbi:response regulator [Paenibacillus piscarius]|uniref:response regulator n=1 Tax=Paenibacillus piscarius TaxID=1089681 RepID=UPI001EE94951|nr:response regulator [Paenibacillus piscarius]
MNLMIVEDEIRILNSLANNIPWNEHGIEVVALAENGLEALAMIGRRKPDIMLLDIEMPEMDGLTLAKTVLQQEPHMKIVILSGHDDFPYAQAAVGLGVMKYLLKPAGDDEILNAILAAAEEIREELMEKHSMIELQRKWRDRLPQLQDDFYRNWIQGRYADWELKKHMEELNLELDLYTWFAVAVCEIDPIHEQGERFTSSDQPLLQFSLECIAAECLQHEDCRVFNDADGATVLLFLGQPEESAPDIIQRINVHVPRLFNIVKECLKLTASAGLGTPGSWEHVSLSYRQARRALQERAIYGNEVFVPYLDVTSKEQPFHYDTEFEKQLEIAVHTDHAAAVAELMDCYFKNVYSQAVSTQKIYEHLLYLSSLFTRMIQSRGWSMQEVLQEDYLRFLSFESLLSKEQIVEWSKRVASRITQYRERERNHSSHRLVKQVIEAVEEMLGKEELTLHTLAERLYVNPSYLSRLFKREEGKSISEYLLKRSMEHAKELLYSGVKVYDAAEAAGYRDVSYFARVFRKYWGVAPSELKKQERSVSPRVL